MTEKKSRRSRLFYQYLLSYLCILLIPLLLMSAFVYNYVLDTLKNEIQTNNLFTLQRARDTIEAQMKYITSLEHSVYLDNVLGQFSLKGDTIKAMEIQKELRRYLQTNSFIYDMAYYQEEDDYIITANSSCRKELFFDRMYPFEEWSYDGFLEDLGRNSTRFFKQSQLVQVGTKENKELITLVLPLKEKTKVRCVMYFIETSFLTDIMPSVEVNNSGSAIIDREGQIIVSTGEGTLMEGLPVGAVNPLKAREMQDYVTLKGDKYLMSYVYSDNYQWSYITLVPATAISDRVNRVTILMTVMCFIACFGGLIGVIFFMKHNYMPIRKLENITNDILENEEDRNGIDHVTRVLEYLNRQNQSLAEDVEIKNIAMRERFIIKLLSGQYEDETQIREKAGKAGIRLDKKMYRVAVFYMYSLPSGRDQEIEDTFMGSIPKMMDVLVRVQPETKMILVAAGYDSLTDDRIEKYLSDMLAIMQSDMGLKGIIGLGSTARELVHLADSYKEAVQSLEYRVVLYDQIIIHYEEIALRGNASFNIRPQELAAYIKNKDIEGLDKFLKAALEEMKWKKADIRQIRRQCNEFLDTIERIIGEMNRNYFMDKPLCYEIINELNGERNALSTIEFESAKADMRYKVENCKELMESLHLISCDIVDHLNELTGRTLVETLLAYVRENCYSCEFSTTAMAEEFKMSLPYLSQYFKNHLGKNLLDYVTELKIEKAKELLADTDYAIREVAGQVGYYNVNSFNRRFKQVTGLTPGEYRKRSETRSPL